MAELITFPHAALAVIDALNARLPVGLKAYPKVPVDNSVPAGGEFIVIKVVGGLGAETLVTSAPQITVDGYAARDARAYEICDLALAIIRSEDAIIRGARGFGYPQNLPDPATSQVRYTSTGEVRVWGTVTP